MIIATNNHKSLPLPLSVETCTCLDETKRINIKFANRDWRHGNESLWENSLQKVSEHFWYSSLQSLLPGSFTLVRLRHKSWLWLKPPVLYKSIVIKKKQIPDILLPHTYKILLDIFPTTVKYVINKLHCRKYSLKMNNQFHSFIFLSI